MSFQNLWRASPDSYRGLPIRCAPGVHAACLAAIEGKVARDARILDLASGSGAFLARLQDTGFRNLTAVERDASICGLAGVSCLSMDLDRPFADRIGARFGLVSAIEIIEHLSSPVAFLGEIRKLLDPGGIALISTPNVSEWKSRIKFLIKGDLRYFDERQYRYQRHISPVVPALVPPMLEEAGLTLMAMSGAGSSEGSLQRHTLGRVAGLLSRLGGGQGASGECLVILARPDTARSAPA